MNDYLNFVDEYLLKTQELLNAKLNENNFYKPNNVIDVHWNTPKNYFIDVCKKWTIKINLKEDNIIPKIFYGENNFIDKYYKKYNNDNESYRKKFNEYKNFLNDVIEYTKKEINNIKTKTNIKLVIKPDIENYKLYNDEDFYNFRNIKCISSFKLDSKKHKFQDKNILVNGIYGKGYGFISLIEELCSQDFLNQDTE